jgi:hypothetical protein
MAVLTAYEHRIRPAALILRGSIVGLTLATAAIHFSLGGTLFLLNAIGYTALAAALALPGPFARGRWLIRYALIGFTATTIAGWLAFGARFDLAYLDKALEITLIGLLLLESWLVDGGPLVVARRAQRIVMETLR